MFLTDCLADLMGGAERQIYELAKVRRLGMRATQEFSLNFAILFNILSILNKKHIFCSI